ncbi:MAG TPA: DUF423 domain-containing protein [Polyangiaceae bacterium]|nr:DUF423 domain-containing protein [Polyangiaceae bacterium]
MERIFLALSGVLGALGVGLGAFGAHGLAARFADLADGADRKRWWETAAHYHLVHALAIAVAAFVAFRAPESRAGAVAGVAFCLGILLFSGSLYAMALTGVRALGAVTPFGGLCFIVGWAAIAVGALRLGP